MIEKKRLTRCAICGTGLLLGIVVFLEHLPALALIVPVAILSLGLVAGPEEAHAAWYGMLNTLGIFELPALTEEEKANWAQKKHYFWFGEVALAAILAGVFAVPAGAFLAGRTEHTLAFIGAALLFLPLFVFLPKLIQQAMKADTDAAIDAFGKNDHVKKVFWAIFIALAGLVLARVADPVTAQKIVGILTGTGG
jgi:hypothetical protein